MTTTTRINQKHIHAVKNIPKKKYTSSSPRTVIIESDPNQSRHPNRNRIPITTRQWKPLLNNTTLSNLLHSTSRKLERLEKTLVETQDDEYDFEEKLFKLDVRSRQSEAERERIEDAKEENVRLMKKVLKTNKKRKKTEKEYEAFLNRKILFGWRDKWRCEDESCALCGGDEKDVCELVIPKPMVRKVDIDEDDEMEVGNGKRRSRKESSQVYYLRLKEKMHMLRFCQRYDEGLLKST